MCPTCVEILARIASIPLGGRKVVSSIDNRVVRQVYSGSKNQRSQLQDTVCLVAIYITCNIAIHLSF